MYFKTHTNTTSIGTCVRGRDRVKIRAIKCPSHYQISLHSFNELIECTIGQLLAAIDSGQLCTTQNEQLKHSYLITQCVEVVSRVISNVHPFVDFFVACECVDVYIRTMQTWFYVLLRRRSVSPRAITFGIHFLRQIVATRSAKELQGF